MMAHDTLVLGVIGGGTRSEAWLAPLADQGKTEPLGRGLSAGANPTFLGLEATLQHLDEAIDRAFADAQIPRDRVASVVFSVAGTEVEGALKAYRDWINWRQVAQRFDVVHDALSTLAAGCPEGWGMALVSATGSVAYARNATGFTGCSGGWGWLLGDDGSGFRVAVEGVRAAIHAYDGRGPQTMLMDAMLEAFQVRSPSELVREVYQFPGNLSKLAAQAPVVTRVAAAGDAAALEIIHSAAKQLASMVLTLVRRPEFGWDEFPLAYSGGVFNDPLMRSMVEKSLHAVGLMPEMEPVHEVTAGAVRLARELWND